MEVPSPAEIRGGTKRDKRTRLEIDSDGDGVFELESAPGKFIRKEVESILPPAPLPIPEPEPTPSLEGASDVRITLIFYGGLVPRVESDEYVEITNLGDEPQDLAGWELVNISGEYPSFIFKSYILNPGVSIRVYTNEVHPEFGGFTFGYGEAIWNDEEPDIAVLYDAQGLEISRKSY